MGHEVDPSIGFQEAFKQCPALAALNEEQAQAIFMLRTRAAARVAQEAQDRQAENAQEAPQREAEQLAHHAQVQDASKEWSLFSNDEPASGLQEEAVRIAIERETHLVYDRTREAIESTESTLSVPQTTEVPTLLAKKNDIEPAKSSYISSVIAPVEVRTPKERITRITEKSIPAVVKKAKINTPPAVLPKAIYPQQPTRQDSVPAVTAPVVSPKIEVVKPTVAVNVDQHSNIPARPLKKPESVVPVPAVLVKNNVPAEKSKPKTSQIDRKIAKPSANVVKKIRSTHQPSAAVVNKAPMSSLEEAIRESEVVPTPVDIRYDVSVPIAPVALVEVAIRPITTKEAVRDSIEAVQDHLMRRKEDLIAQLDVQFEKINNEITAEPKDIEQLYEKLITLQVSSETKQKITEISTRIDHIKARYALADRSVCGDMGTHESKQSKVTVGKVGRMLGHVHSALGSMVLIASRRSVVA